VLSGHLLLRSYQLLLCVRVLASVHSEQCVCCGSICATEHPSIALLWLCCSQSRRVARSLMLSLLILQQGNVTSVATAGMCPVLCISLCSCNNAWRTYENSVSGLLSHPWAITWPVWKAPAIAVTACQSLYFCVQGGGAPLHACSNTPVSRVLPFPAAWLPTRSHMDAVFLCVADWNLCCGQQHGTQAQLQYENVAYSSTISHLTSRLHLGLQLGWAQSCFKLRAAVDGACQMS